MTPGGAIAEPSEPWTAGPAPGDGATARRGRRRVLVVDDSRLQRRLLTVHLARLDLEVIEAECGEEALALCRERPVDIVLSDWMMPGLSGIDLCLALRAAEARAAGGGAGGEAGGYVYFILLTSKGEKAEIAEGLGAGADDFLTKPVDGAELVARVQAGERILAMQEELRETGRARGEALAELRALNAAIDRDLREARQLQRSLIREWERDLGAAQVTLLLESAGHVGGDMVGFFPTGEGRLGLYSIDVSGHGITSALLAARLAAVLSSGTHSRNLALSVRGGRLLGRPPAEVPARLNALALDEMCTDRYFTMAYADLDLASGALRFAQAGHPPPLVLRADGRAEFPGGGGLPVGLIPDAEWEEHALRLGPGDRLLVYTDGVTECADPSGAMLEEEGLVRLARARAGLAGRPFLDALLADLRAHRGGEELEDDVSMALLEYRGA